ncbi:choline-responsive transcriptional repressor BetI [Sedimentitalea sp. HM32M-2]|uniref:choline-binding transcriptional repressor BetI n=1 Tax=Sedimentitalea sp. HM32M-2 TaxID=3351566 RepID=UPI00363C1BDE
MPKVGMEPIRREALVKATIAEIGSAGSLDVTVNQIARRAGMSSALAHHYFGGKQQIFLAAMRRILTDFGATVRHELREAAQQDRAAAIIRACFAPACFAPATIGAWMTFYVMAQSDDDALRLWRIYQRRLRSNLTHALGPLVANPAQAADTLAALIDGLYIRAALHDPDAPQIAIEQALSVLALLRQART